MGNESLTNISQVDPDGDEIDKFQNKNTKVFGVDIDELMKKENENYKEKPQLPALIIEIFEYLDENAHKTSGIFTRYQPLEGKKYNNLKKKIDSGKIKTMDDMVDELLFLDKTKWVDVFAHLFREWVQNLPSLMDSTWIEFADTFEEGEILVEEMARLYQKVSPGKKLLIKRLFLLLHRIYEWSPHNGMNARKLCDAWVNCIPLDKANKWDREDCKKVVKFCIEKAKEIVDVKFEGIAEVKTPNFV